MGWPAVVPPAGRGWGWARPCRGAGEGKVGRFLRKRRGHGADREDSFPKREVAARMGREGGGRRVGGPGLQGGRSGCGGVQRVAWNSSRLGVRTARRSKFLSVGSLPMVLTRSRRESGTWPNRVSRTSRIASRAFWTMPFSSPFSRPFSRPSLRASSSKRVMWGMVLSGRRCWSWFLNWILRSSGSGINQSIR